MRLAKEQGAQVTALYVMPDYSAMIYGAEALMAYNAAEFNQSAHKDADKVLQAALEIAQPRVSLAEPQESPMSPFTRPSFKKRRKVTAT
ncbi:hypothetical protein J4714_13800 [Staphylococcus epidermidis]|nr:hypothetical protein [Staphylococcus epidermidis]